MVKIITILILITLLLLAGCSKSDIRICQDNKEIHKEALNGATRTSYCEKGWNKCNEAFDIIEYYCINKMSNGGKQ